MRAEARCKTAAHCICCAERGHDGISVVGCGGDSRGLQLARADVKGPLGAWVGLRPLMTHLSLFKTFRELNNIK